MSVRVEARLAEVYPVCDTLTFYTYLASSETVILVGN